MDENRKVLLKNGLQLGYALYGDPQGKPLFYFHGWPSSRFQARILDSTAKKLHICVISIDRPGYGISDFQQKRTLLDWPDTVCELADNIGIKKFSVIGVSGGGPYAAVCGYKIPYRVTKVGIVVGLAPTDVKGVLQGMGFFNKLAWQSYHLSPFFMQVTSLLHLGQARKFLPETAFYRSRTDKKLLSPAVKNDIIQNRNEAFRQGKKGAALDLKLYTGAWGFHLQNIKTSVFLWYGGSDKQVSVKMGEYYAAQIPKSKLTIYPNEGHFLIKKHAEEILKTLTST